jgi:demethylmenaquinone methyltransferase/2-methoxy-6-polyprenyl-1,4-benzoquinol methylase
VSGGRGSFESVHGRESGSWAVRDQENHGKLVRAMFARIAGVYDFMNHLLSFNRDKAWRRNVVKRVDGDAWEVLDLCAGTGDLALACMRGGKGRAWIAADFCPEMLQGADGKPGAERLARTAADAMQLPLKDHSVDVVTVGFGVRNFADVRRGLGEIARVLRPGGQLLVLEFFRDDREARGDERGVAGPIRIVVSTLVRVLGRLVGRDGSAYSYLPSSMDQFLTPRELRAVMQEFGFTDVQIERQTFGIAHIVGGRLP